MIDPFTALADRTRRAILRLLAREELPAGRIAASFPQQRPAISKHLTILKRAGLIRETRVRQQRVYGLSEDTLTEVRAFLAEVSPLGGNARDESAGIRQDVVGQVVPESQMYVPIEERKNIEAGEIVERRASLTLAALPRLPVRPQVEAPLEEPSFPQPAVSTFSMEFD